MIFEFISNLGIYIFFISIFLGLILFFYIQQEDFYQRDNHRLGGYLDKQEEGKYKWSKYISLIGLWFITFLVWFRYIDANQGLGIANIFEHLQVFHVIKSSEFLGLYIILLFVAILFPLPSLVAIISSFIAISSVDIGIIIFILFATVQTVSYIYLDFEEIDLYNKHEFN
jgi:hypothetical protein